MSGPGKRCIRAVAFRLMLVLLIAAIEWSLVLWAGSWHNYPARIDPGQVCSISARGAVGVSIPREAAGRYPYDKWTDSFNAFVPILRLTGRGTNGLHMRVLMIFLPWWSIVLVLALVTTLLIKRHGLVMNCPPWRWRPVRRGFEPIMSRTHVSPPPPAARTEE